MRRFDLAGTAALVAVMIGVSLLPAAAGASAPLVVTNTSDSGPGSLRAAITAANASSGSTIVFNLPTSDTGFNGHWFTIVPLTPLPIVAADDTTIDGSTQTTFTGDTNPAGPEIFLDGRSEVEESPQTPRSLWIESRSTVEGLTISGFAGFDVVVDGAHGAVVRGDYVGVDPTGTSVIFPPSDLRAFENDGVMIMDSATNTVIGGTTVADRSVISANDGTGNAGSGVLATSPDNGVVVEGNYIGTNATGSAALAHTGSGVMASAYGQFGNDPPPSNVTIDGNLISGTTSGGGVWIDATDVTIRGNLIGTDAGGTLAIPNQNAGVTIGPSVNVLLADNVISGNAGPGIDLFGIPEDSSLIGNFIGTDRTGKTALPNAGDGVKLEGGASGNVVRGNTIADNLGSGVDVVDGTGDTISRNSIFSNSALGIDLGGDGVTPNDPGDTDTGPNNLQNFPVLTSALASSGHLVVTGTIDTQSPQSVTLEFFANTVPTPGGDPSGYGEGAVYLGSATPASNGTFSATLPSVAAQTLISATATSESGDTSEFAKDIPAVTLPTSADQCKKGGWQKYGIFKNQGDCVSYVATGGKNPPAGSP